MAELERTQIRGRGLAIDFPSHLLSRGYASSVADRGDLTKPSQAVRHNTPARSVSNRYLGRRSRARVVLEPRASSQISKNSNNRQIRSIFENVDIRAEDTDVFRNATVRHLQKSNTPGFMQIGGGKSPRTRTRTRTSELMAQGLYFEKQQGQHCWVHAINMVTDVKKTLTDMKQIVHLDEKLRATHRDKPFYDEIKGFYATDLFRGYAGNTHRIYMTRSASQ